MILKIIGTILLVILGIAVALILIVLFVPIRYEASGSRSGKDMTGRAKVTWLLHAVSFRIGYNADGADGLTKELRIFGIPLEKIKAFFQRKKKDRRVRGRKKRLAKLKKKDPQKFDQLKAEAEARRKAAQAEKEEEEKRAREEEEKKRLAREAEEKAEAAKKAEKKPAENLLDIIFRIIVRAVSFIGEKAAFVFTHFLDIVLALFHLPQKIAEAVGAFFRKVGGILGNVQKWMEFIGDERTHAALKLVLKKLGKLLKHIRPKKLRGDVTFGLGDPAGTGTVLAGISALYPLYAGHVVFTPDFDKKELNGSLEMKGRIFLFYVVFTALTVYFNKNVKYVISFIKNSKEEKENG